MTGMLVAELLKLRTVRSTYYALGVALGGVGCSALFASYAGRTFDAASVAHRAHVTAAVPEQGFLPLVEICLAVLGVLAISSEYATGTLRSSITAVPARGRLFAAKIGAVALIALVAGEALMFAMFAVARAVAGGRHLFGDLQSLSGALTLLLASGLLVMVTTLVGLGLGTLTRSTASGIIAVVIVLFVLPTTANFLPGGWSGRARSVMLPNLAFELVGSHYEQGLVLSRWGAAVVLALYLAAPLTAAVVLIRRRDVR